MTTVECRTCLQHHEVYRSILEQPLKDAVTLIGDIQINDDELPKAICEECATVALAALKFRTTCQKSDDILKNRSISKPDPFIKNLGSVDIQNDEDSTDIHDFPCDYRCTDADSSTKHKSVHSVKEILSCDKCSFQTNTINLLKSHSSVHEIKTFSCKLCSFRCRLASGLSNHITRMHERQKNFSCSYCGKRFFSRSHRNVHLRTHTGEKPYACEKCGLAFSQKSNLEKHIRLIHNNSSKTYSCSLCEFVARSGHTLKNHEKKHTGERPMKCNQCNYTCITLSALTLHKRRHSGDAQYSCEMCDYKCYTSGRLKVHKRIHTGERPYACDSCNYRSKTGSGLKNHKLSHDNERKYSCTKCNYRTNYRSNLNKHKLKQCDIVPKECALQRA